MPDFQADLSVLRNFGEPTVKAETPADWAENTARQQAAQAVIQERQAKAQAAEEARADELMIRQIGQETGGDPNAISARLRVVNPRAAMKFDTDWADVQKKNVDRAKAENENERAQLDQHLGLLKAAEARPDLYPVARARILKEDPTMEPFLPEAYDPQAMKAMYAMGLQAKDITEMNAKALEYRVKGDWVKSAAMVFADPTMDAKEVAEEAQGMILNGYPPDVVASFKPDQWTPDFAKRALQRGMTPNERVDNERADALQTATIANQQFDNETARGQLDVSRGNLRVAQGNLGQRIAEDKRQAAQAAAGGGGADGRGDLIEAVIANPGLYDQITPTERGKIAGELQRRGFTGFGRPLSESAAKQLAATDAATASLADLREILKKNEQYLGPVAGLAALNPYSEARKAQADIDLVRQRVGKALEGGVLRKEDEEKYKLILATLRDTPETAIYKVDQLVKDLERDKAAFVHQQRLTGRRVPQTPAAATGGGAETTAAPAKKANPFRKTVNVR